MSEATGGLRRVMRGAAYLEDRRPNGLARVWR